MAIPSLPASGSTDWYAWATGVDGAARDVASKVDSTALNAKATATSTTTSNPGFVGSGDYHLAAGSTAIGRGTQLGYSTDLDDLPRTVGAAPDSGCYERQS